LSAVLQAGQNKPIPEGSAPAFAPGGHPLAKQQGIETALIQCPVAHWPRIDMEETRVGVPADAATSHGTRGLHGPLVAAVEPDVKRAPIDVLAVLGDT